MMKAKAVEVAYKFKVPEEGVISQMSIQIDDRTIEGTIMEKKKAADKYEDAVA